MQPVGAGQYTVVSGTAAGTANVHDKACVLERVIMGDTSAGTVTLYDNAAGTSTATQVLVVDQSETDAPTSLECNFRLRNGLSVAKAGATSLVLITRL